MPNKILVIKRKIKEECINSKFIGSWFYDAHLLGVEKFAKFLVNKLPRADKEEVFLGVWLHDLQRIRGIKGDHAKIGAKEAGGVMKEFGYQEKTIKNVKKIILAHCCDTKLRPKTLESKILASADAMSHYINDFYLIIATTGQRDVKNFRKWALEKLDRDYNNKIFFDFAKKEIRERHNLLKKVFTMR